MSPLNVPSAIPNKFVIPAAFIENKGQVHESVHFYIQQEGSTTFLTTDGMTVSLSRENTRVVLKSIYVNATPSSRLEGQGIESGKMHYLIGNQFERHRTDISRFNALYQSDVWPGIDLSLRYTDQGLKSDWIVHPGANPDCIEVAWMGMDNMGIDEAGDLIISHSLGELREQHPYCYQQRDDVELPVECRYIVQGERCKFAIKSYDSSLPLIIDPPIQFGSYIGGSSNDDCFGIAVDLQGHAYVVGQTESANFPTTAGSFQPNFIGTLNDAYVAKVNSDFRSLIYCTFLGGSVNEGGGSVVVDDSGHAYVGGHTYSSDFPVTPGAFQTTFHGGAGEADAFITKLSTMGNSLVFSTYLGGGGQDLVQRQELAIDAEGFIYVSGTTASTDFPVTPGAYQTALSGTRSGFISKLTPAANALVFSTYLGGNGGAVDNAALALGQDGHIYVAGATSSPSFPTTPGAYRRTYAGGATDGFVCKMAPSGSSLVYSTYIGGNGLDSFNCIAVDANGSAYVGGHTTSTNYPTTGGAVQRTPPAGQNAMLSRLATDGSALVGSTYLGGSNIDRIAAGRLHSNGNMYVAGQTNSTDFPVTSMLPPTTNPGGYKAFVSVLNPLLSSLILSFYFGGGTSATITEATSMVINNTGVYLAGYTNSADFPVSTGAFQPIFHGGAADGFVIKLSDMFSASKASMAVIKLS